MYLKRTVRSMKVRVMAKELKGKISAVSSKSDAHRAVICAALCDGDTEVLLGEFSDDISATAECLAAMGAKITRTENGYILGGGAVYGAEAFLNCAESGSTLRFLLPVAAALGGRKKFYGAGRLPSRPMLPLMTALESHNIAFDNKKSPASIDIFDEYFFDNVIFSLLISASSITSSSRMGFLLTLFSI